MDPSQVKDLPKKVNHAFNPKDIETPDECCENLYFLKLGRGGTISGKELTYESSNPKSIKES